VTRIAAQHAPVAPDDPPADEPDDDGLTRYAATVVVEEVTSRNW